MKLLFCFTCNDVVKLNLVDRTCSCGQTRGKYLDDKNAEIKGPGVLIALNNRTLEDAVRSYKKNPRLLPQPTFHAAFISEAAVHLKRVE
jgi:hypothetical protein